MIEEKIRSINLAIKEEKMSSYKKLESLEQNHLNLSKSMESMNSTISKLETKEETSLSVIIVIAENLSVSSFVVNYSHDAQVVS